MALARNIMKGGWSAGNAKAINGAIASEFVARATPDGHTLMLGYIATHAMNPALQKLRYDPVTDFEPIGLVGYSPTLMVANAHAPVKDVRDLVALVRRPFLQRGRMAGWTRCASCAWTPSTWRGMGWRR